MDDLEHWSKRHLARLRAALERLHPEAARLVPGASGLDGGEAVLAVATLLRRTRELAAREPNDAVLETLTRRGFDATLRSRLTALVEAAGLYVTLKRPDEAIQTWEQVLALAPERADAIYALAKMVAGADRAAARL